MKHTSFLTAVVVLSLGLIPVAYGKDQKADQNAQVTIGGAKSLVSGEIRKIEGEYYFIKDDEAGDEVRLLVNKDANLDCSAATISTAGTPSQSVITKRQPLEQQAAEASDRQKEQGQKKDETAVGSGFSIGACSFKAGDLIKAEVDDMGRVTTLKFMRTRGDPQTARSLGESAGTGELAIPGKQENPGQLDMTGPHGYPPKEYAMLPVPLGELKSVGNENSLLHSSVKNAEGKVIGSLDSLLMDSQTGQIEYAVVLLNDSKRLEAVPWAHMKIGSNQAKQAKLEFTLDTTHFQLSPSPGAAKDRSLEVEKLIKDLQTSLRAVRAESRNPERGTIDKAKIEIIMQHQGYDVKGHSVPDSLTAIVLRNQDTETHGFSSPLFKDLVIRTEGDAIEVKKNGIRSYHVPAGKTATLYFTQVSRVDPSTGIRETRQYPFRCDIHPDMKGAFLVVETRGEMGGG